MASKVSICSNALLLLGAQTINALDENNDRARTMANLYPFVRESVLRMHPWNCAKRRVLLSPLAEAPAFDWSYQFALPGDWIRTIQVGYLRTSSAGAWIEGNDYLTEVGRILGNMNSLPLIYVSNLTEEAQFDAQLTYAMTVAMSAAAAYTITKSTSQQQAQEAKLEQILKKARAEDAQDDPAQTLGDNPLYDARYGTFPMIPGRT